MAWRSELPEVNKLGELTGFLRPARDGRLQSDYEAASLIVAQSVAIRGVASAWILASLSGAGLLLNETGSLEPESGLGAAVASLLSLVLAAGAAGLLLLWALDRRFNYRLLDSAFVLGLALEKAHPTLLAPVSRLMAEATHSGVVHWFYLAPAGGFVVAAWWSAISGGAVNPGGLAVLVVTLAFASAFISTLGKQPLHDVIEHRNKLEGPSKGDSCDG